MGLEVNDHVSETCVGVRIFARVEGSCVNQLAAAFRHIHVRGLSCVRKRAYATEDDAYAHLRNLLGKNARNHTPERDEGLNVHLCQLCGSFHVGHWVRN